MGTFLCTLTFPDEAVVVAFIPDIPGRHKVTYEGAAFRLPTKCTTATREELSHLFHDAASLASGQLTIEHLPI